MRPNRPSCGSSGGSSPFPPCPLPRRPRRSSAERRDHRKGRRGEGREKIFSGLLSFPSSCDLGCLAPRIVDTEHALRDVELAVLSAVAHGNHDVTLELFLPALHALARGTVANTSTRPIS